MKRFFFLTYGRGDKLFICVFRPGEARLRRANALDEEHMDEAGF